MSNAEDFLDKLPMNYQARLALISETFSGTEIANAFARDLYITLTWEDEGMVKNLIERWEDIILKMEPNTQSQTNPITAEEPTSNTRKMSISDNLLILIGYLALPLVPLVLIFGALVAMDVLPNTEEVTNLCISLDLIIGIAIYAISMIVAKSND